ncbi:filamentous hemagglutinin N-terminal domain-containing protein [Sphingomonas sp. KR3-1]|uniref:beta strand repeat-containing protein n=1 Tax=Sphingomonas sp. KR3-1 TaxID=3156611 RepID=UPI0032B601A1
MSKQHTAKALIASSTGGRRLKRSALLLSAAMAAIALANPAHAQLAPNALPTNGTVVAGGATIGTPTPSSMTVNQSTDRAVINWNTFDIGSGASVAFVQPSSTSVAVNRVTGGGPGSEIAGQLSANGRIVILNPNGVQFSNGSVVNVGSLIASTGDIDTNAFMAGGNLDITGATGGEIVVNGNINITAGNLGLAAFVAPTVRNSGVITATAGRVQLGGGTAFTLDLAGDGLLSIGVPASSALVQNNGQIFAEGGRIQMTAKSAGAVVDNLVNTGTLSVDSATMDNGTIVLEAMGGSANLSGTIAVNDRNSISRNLQISSDQGVNISGNLRAASGTVNITAPHIYGTGRITTGTALNLNLSNNGTDTTGLGNYINDALGVIGTTGFGTTLKLGAGTYKSGVRIDASDVTIDGQGVARIGWTSGIENAIDIWGDYVTVKNLEISGPATSGYTSFAWGSTNSRGIFVNRFADNVQLLNNNIHDIRTGIIVDGRNANTYLLDNTIDNTKSAISIQYTDGSNVTMTGNHGSTYGNEWGINLYLNGILQADGTTILPSAGSLGANTPLAEQQRLLALRAANGNMEVQNQGYSALNRTAAYVSTTGSNSNQGSPLGTLATIQAGVNAVVTGGTVHVADGNYNLGASQLVINHSLSLIGASQAGVVIDGRAVSANGLGTISVLADNVSLSNFSLLGSQLSGGNYGIKVAPNPAGHVSTAGGTSERVSNFSVSNVTVSGSRRAELDLNGVIGATIANFTADGQGTDGAGIQITDSSNVTLTGVHTLGNNWGGVALYQSNSASGYNAQTTNINIDANQNVFEEANGLFTQRDSTTQSFGQLNLTGFNYAVRNIGSRADAAQFVWFQTDLTRATAFALALGASGSSLEGYSGTAFTNIFTVSDGLQISSATRDVRTGGTINVGAGTYASGSLITANGVTLVGAAGARIDATHDGDNAITISGDNVSVSGFDIFGAADQSYVTYAWPTITRGFVIANGADNVTVSGNTIRGVRNGILIDGRNANTSLTNNLIDNTKSAISVQYTDGSNLTIAGNREGTFGNEWGVIAYLNGIWNGSTITASGGALGANTPLSEQARLLALSAANGGMAVYNQGYSAANRTRAYVNTAGTANGQGSQRTTISSVQAGVDAVVSGGTLYVANGTYTLSNTLFLQRALTLVGASEAGVIFDASALSVYGMRVHADNVTLSGFSLLAPNAISNSTYGLKVEVGAGDTNGNGRVDNFAISNVSISGSRKTGLDLNSVVGATLDNVSVTGALAGNGITITDSANVTVRNSSTAGNAWGGLALYQANGATGSTQQLTGITIEGNNSFGESNGLYLQDSSAINDPGTLSIAGHDYIVRNAAFRPDGSQFTFFRTSLNDATSYALSLATPTSSSIEGWTGSAGTNVFIVVNGLGINAATRDARAGATINVGPGTYLEGVTGVDYYGGAGSQTFGLYVAKNDITIRGVDAAGNLITNADDVVAYIAAAYQSGFGAQHFISGSGVTIEGLGFLPAANGDNKTIEVIGNRFTLTNSVIDNRGNETAANLYIDDFDDAGHERVESFTITGNKFYGGTYASAMVVVAGGAGRTTDASNRIFSDNYLTSDLAGMRGFQIQGYMPTTPWQQLYAGAVTVTGNIFDVDVPVRTVGLLSSGFAWDDVFRNNGNSFLQGGVLAYEGSTNAARATTTAGGDPDIRITSTIGASIARAQNGDTVRILDGTYVLGSQLAISKSISLIGQSQAGTIIDGRAVNDGGGLGTIGVFADNTTLSNFTLLGSQLSGGNYGIKVQPDPVAYSAAQRISNVTISDVTVKGSRRAELDINGAVGVTITNFSADGQGTEGAGVQITDSANVLLAGVHTLNNNWGGVALYQTNRAGGYDGQTTDINIAASDNDFEEANGLFAQLESTTQGFGQLNLSGYGYAVRNTGSRSDGSQFTYFRTDLADATAWALGLGAANTSSIEGYTGTAFSNVFTVTDGLQISAATRDVRAGGTINVGAGTYASGSLITANGVQLLGANGAKIDASHGGDNGITINADGVTVTGFEIFGDANQSYVTYAWPTVTRGIVVSNGADNVTVTGNNIHDVRNGILIDGRNANTSLTNNLIDNTKSAISVQYTDGSNLTIAGNREGTFGNEWGVIAYLNGIWNGSTITASGGALGTNTPLSEQARLLALSSANGGMAVYNQGYSAANRTRAYVDPTGTAGAQGSLRTLANLQAGLSGVVAGGTVYIASGSYAEDVTLNALRVLNIAGPISVNSLSFGAGAAGTNIGTSITASGALSFADGLVLTGDTVLSGNSITLGAITSPYGLTLNGTGTVSIGLADLASLTATGSTILTNGAFTSGAQLYTGATSLDGTYSAGGSFTVSGLATLAGDAEVSTGGDAISFASLDGGHNLVVDADTGAVTLGTANGLASLSVSGATISTAGATTTGGQSYNGATTLGGSYATGSDGFVVNGTATLAGTTNVSSNGGDIDFSGTVGGAHQLGADAGTGSVFFGGAVSGLTGLSAAGADIVTAGVATSGDQSYTGATALGGSYTTGGGSLTVQGGATLTGATSIATNGGAATLGSVSGAGRNLSVNAGAGTATIGAATGLGALDVTGGTIATSGAATSGAQNYTGATTLNGAYTTGGSSFTVNGAATAVNAVSVVTGGGNAGFGTVGGAGGLTVDAGTGNVTLGAVSGIASLSATGANIATSGATTSGAQSFVGATSLNGTYSASSFASGATTLGGATNISTTGNASLGSVAGGGNALTLTAGAGVALGAASGLASLTATGATIATSGVATSGAQRYTGATTLNGAYTTGGGSFAVNGATTTVNAASVTTGGGNAGFGTVGGAGGLTVNAGTGSASLGAVSGIASLSVTGATIATAGASTVGAQSYSGATTLNGTYAASSFAAGATTLGGATSVSTTGNASLGAVTGGGNALTLTAGSGVTLGAASGLASLTATGATIATSGVATTGAQSYTGATSLNGTYTASSFTSGATTLGGNTAVSSGGNASFGTLGGANSLTVTATGSVTLGAATGLTSLSATGATIATSGAVTTGAQSYTGATTLNGSYTASSFTSGATTLGGATSVSTTGNTSLGTVAGGGNALALSAGTGVTLGAASGLASLSATGTTIATSGVATTGAQSYTGAITLNGAYTASSFISGATVLGSSTSVTTTGNATLGNVGGTGSLTVNAGAGSASLGAVTGLSGLSVTGATIATSGAATSGAQAYTGATSLNGAYTTGGAAFTVTGAASLAGNTSVTSGNGGITLGAVDAAVAGGQSLTLDAGTGTATLGTLGAVRRLGATSINAGATVLNGATYAANSLAFTGGAGATVRLTQGTTTLNTSIPGGAGGNIAIAPNLIGTTNAAQNVVFTAGNGITVNSGDVTLGNLGSDALRLGTLSVTAHNFTAATVKLAGNFNSILSGSQLFSANTLDTLGSVNAVVAGNESGPIKAGGSVTIDAGGSGSGSIIAGGAVNAQYDSNVTRTITSQSDVILSSLGAITGSVTATGGVNLQTTAGAINAAVTSGGATTLSSTSGAIGGSIAANGPVGITTTSGGVTSSVTTPGTASIASQTGSVNATVTGNGGVSVTSNGAITGNYTSPTAITLTSTRPVDVSVNGAVVTVTAPGGTVTGVFSEIHTNDQGSFVVNDQPVVGNGTTDARQILIDTFIIPAHGTVSTNGEVQLPAGLALGLIAPAGNGSGGQRPAVVVNNVQRLGELLRLGYTAIIIQLDDSNLDVEEELAGQ